MTSNISLKHCDTPTALRLNIEYRPPGELRPAADNPRQHSARQIGQIARSMKTFGALMPIVTGPDDEIIVGHGRHLAALRLGLKEVPTIPVGHLSTDELKALRIADNQLTDNSKWDDRLLAESLKYLSSVDLSFDLEVIGIDWGEIEMRTLSLSPETQEEVADEVLSEPAEPPISRLGDLWQLGPHRMLCADALMQASLESLMGPDRARMVFIDPPYNVSIQGHVGGRGKIRHREFAMATGEKSRAEFTAFLKTALTRLMDMTDPGSLVYCCMDWRHTIEVVTSGEEACGELKNICVWTKDNPGQGSFYRSQHELVFVFKRGKVPHRNNVALGKNGRNRSNVWSYPGVNSFSRANDEGNLLALHPTVKPVALIADAILDCTKRKEIVLDSFAGSGSTLLAAERTGRIFRGIEIDPLYVDTTIRRWQRLTGGSATHAVTGLTFDAQAKLVRG